MRIHVAHLNCQDGGHGLMEIFAFIFYVFIWKLLFLFFIWKEIHKMVDISFNESRKRHDNRFSSGLLLGQVQLL